VSYLARKLWYSDADGQHWLSQDALCARREPVIVLGEPGMGKSELLARLGSESENAFCRAGQLINRANPATLLGTAKRLVIDALDEVSAQREGDAVDLVLRKLGELDYPPFVLSCRVSEWRAAIATQAIADQYELEPLELHLEPFDRDEQHALLTELTSDAARASELIDHFETFGLDFLGNPQTLNLVAALPAGQALPKTSSELFEQAIETLRKERNKKKTELPRDLVLDAAGAAFAGLILTGNARIVDKPSGAINSDDKALALNEIDAFDSGNVSRAANTNLFVADKTGLTYAHRRIGEFVGARWLAARADTRAKRKRLLGRFRSQGLVPANLRGLHAWLARDPNLALAVIDADPMGVVEYGDAEGLTTSQARALFAALERLAHDNPRFRDWQHYRAASLVSKPLLPEVIRVVGDRNAEFGLRVLLLQQLQNAETAFAIRDLLRDRMLDVSEAYAIRHAAAGVLIAIKGEDWPALLEQLRRQVRQDSLRLAHELLDDIDIGAISDTQIVEIVLARDGLSVTAVPPEPEQNMVSGYWRLADVIPAARLETLLDTFTEYTSALLPEHAGIDENDLIDFAYALVLRRLEEGGAVEPLKLWGWLKPLGEQTSYRRNRGKTVAAWLKANTSLRRAIQRHVILDTADDDDLWRRALRLARSGGGLGVEQDDVLVLLDALDPNQRSDERWREVLNLGQTWGDEGRALRDAAKPFAAHRPDLLAWIDSLAERPIPDWQRKQDEKERQRKAKQAAKFAEHRADFLANIERVRAGDFGAIVGPAQAYLKRFHDMGDDALPHERVAEWLGEDIAAAAHEGFQAFLKARPPRPNAGQIARSYAVSKRWAAGDIIVAALAERVRTMDEPFLGVSDERLMAGLFECWHAGLGESGGLKLLAPKLENELGHRGKWEAAIRLYIEPQLRRRRQHVDRLWAVMHEENGEAGTKLAEDWLARFPQMSGEAESEMIDRLLRSNRRDTLRGLLADRLARELSDERRRNWDAVGLIVDFEATQARLGAAIERDLLWHLRNRIGDRRREEGGLGARSVEQLAWAIATFRELWPAADRPGTLTTGDVNAWDASDYIRTMITRIGNDVSGEAVSALAALRNAPPDGYTTALRIVAAEQRQKQADESYTSPSLDEIKAVLAAGPPGSVDDLRAIIIDEIDELAKRLRGSSEDEINLFWTDDAKPRTENECRDRVVITLRGHLQPLSIYPATEADMPQGKRADIVFQHGPLLLPVEAKRQQHPDIWTAIDEQLERFYSGHWQAEGQGLFLVFWFGPHYTIKAPPDGGLKPTSAAELQRALDAHRAVKSGRVVVIVLDLSRST
jgi:hypothetical protein